MPSDSWLSEKDGDREMAKTTKVLTTIHTNPHTKELRAVGLTIGYQGGSAELLVHVDGPRSHDIDLAEVIRLELQSLIEALEAVAASSDNILLPGRTPRE
jgi:hypothetical protein